MKDLQKITTKQTVVWFSSYIRFSFLKWNTTEENVKCCIDYFSLQNKLDFVLSDWKQIKDVSHFRHSKESYV